MKLLNSMTFQVFLDLYEPCARTRMSIFAYSLMRNDRDVMVNFEPGPSCSIAFFEG